MNKCKDCEWFASVKGLPEYQCCWKPIPILVPVNYGCGQFKPNPLAQLRIDKKRKETTLTMPVVRQRFMFS